MKILFFVCVNTICFTGKCYFTGNTNTAAAQPMAPPEKEPLGKLRDFIDVQQELEAVKNERDALLKEKEEWSKERIMLKNELISIYAKVTFNLSQFFFTISNRKHVTWYLY